MGGSLIEFFSSSLWAALVVGFTWVAFSIPSFFGTKVSLPANVALFVPVVALNVVIATKIVDCFKAVAGW